MGKSQMTPALKPVGGSPRLEQGELDLSPVEEHPFLNWALAPGLLNAFIEGRGLIPAINPRGYVLPPLALFHPRNSGLALSDRDFSFELPISTP